MPGENAPLQDRSSFENLYARAHLVVFRYIYGLHGGPVEEVEDLTADTFLRAWNARGRFRGDEAAALGWLLHIARNRTFDALRREKTQRGQRGVQLSLDEDLVELELPGQEATPEEQASFREQAHILQAVLLSLPIEQREMLVLRYVLGWPVKRIGEHLDLLENTVSVNLRRALQRMRQRWPQESMTDAENRTA
jgi:RNA polymerase sigma-70 factor, ECF subfamily